MESGLSAPNNLTSIAGNLASDLWGAFDAGLTLPSLHGSVVGDGRSREMGRTEPEATAVVAPAQARVEEQLKHMTEKLDRAIARIDLHEDTLSGHETRLAERARRRGRADRCDRLRAGRCGSAVRELPPVDRVATPP
jgi:hypothetical protein